MLWLIGNSGMLGSAVEKILLNEKLQYWATGREADITDYRQIERFSKNKEIAWVINCSGYTQVDKAEAEPERAFQTNRNGVHNIAQFCLKKNVSLFIFPLIMFLMERKNYMSPIARWTSRTP